MLKNFHCNFLAFFFFLEFYIDFLLVPYSISTPGARVCENCVNKIMFHYISTPKKGGNKRFFVGRGVDCGALCTVPVMKRKIALLVFLVMCPENHGEGACVKIV